MTSRGRSARWVAAARTSMLPSPVCSPARSRPTACRVTKREREVLRLLADGMRNEQVARQLSISTLTVRTHVKNAMQKLEADTRTEAVAKPLRESLIS